MAQEVTKKAAEKPADIDIAAAEFSTFALEESADKKQMRISIGIAAVFHFILLLITFPEIIARPTPR